MKKNEMLQLYGTLSHSLYGLFEIIVIYDMHTINSADS